MTVKSMQQFTEQAQTELAINLLTEKIPKGKRSKVWLYFAPKYSNIATCSKCNKTIACKEGREGKESTAVQQPKTRVGYREPVPIWNRFQYNRYLPGPKCNADFG